MYLICKKGCNLMLKQKWAKLHHEFFFIAFVNATVTKYGNKSYEAIVEYVLRVLYSLL